MSLSKRALAAINRRFEEVHPKVAMARKGWVARTEDNLGQIRWLGKGERESALGYYRKDGVSLRGKVPRMNAVHSSAALTLNTFGPWVRRVEELNLAGRGHFRTLVLAESLEVAPHLKPADTAVLASGFEGVVAVESRFIEPLEKEIQQKPFAEHFAYFRRMPNCEIWYEQTIKINRNPMKFRYLDARRLVNQALGLLGAYGPGPLTLLYLYWEPANWEMFDEYRSHRNEVEAFIDEVRRSPVTLVGKSYRSLWREMRADLKDEKQKRHIEGLESRYNLSI